MAAAQTDPDGGAECTSDPLIGWGVAVYLLDMFGA